MMCSGFGMMDLTSGYFEQSFNNSERCGSSPALDNRFGSRVILNDTALIKLDVPYAYAYESSLL